MSDYSSDSREPSPRFYRPASPGSDTESVAPTSWAASSVTLHPSSYRDSEAHHAPLLGKPVGFGANPALVQHPPSSNVTSAPSHHVHPMPPLNSQSMPGKQSSKRKEKATPKDKSREASRKGKERDKGARVEAVAHSAQPPPQPGYFPPDTHTKKAFRVHAYKNDPAAGGTPYPMQQGPYGAAYRAHVAERSSSNIAYNPSPHASPVAPTPNVQPRPSYYRHDYEKTRESAPAIRAKRAAEAAAAAAIPPPTSAPHDSVTPHHAYPHVPTTPNPTPSDHRHSSRSSKRKDTQPHPTDHPYPPVDGYSQQTPDPYPSGLYEAAPAPALNPHFAETSPSPAPSRHKRRSHRHDQQTHQSSPAPIQIPSQPASQLPAQQPHPPVRILRVLTLLIEDKRTGDGENMLTEVRVPLKDDGNSGFWADAQDVTEELQKGPSRIDGAAKIYTMRGKFKQYFLRISADGEVVCQSANLQCSADRTLEIFIDDNPPPAGMALATSISPPRIERELLTPVTDSMTSPSPAPTALPGPKRDSRSSLFSAEDLPSPAAEEPTFSNPYPSPKKRPRSASVQSIQSVQSEGYLQPNPHDAYSPFTNRSPSAQPSSASQSRTSSQTFPPAQAIPAEPTQMSPISLSPSLPASQQLSTQIHRDTSMGHASSSSTLSSSSIPGPSPPKKQKLSVTQPARHTEHSVSPGPSQPGSFPWSNSRTPSNPKEPSKPGFAAYANPAVKTTLTMSATPSNPFAQYESGAFSLPTPQSEASNTPAPAPTIALPTMTTTIPTIAPTVPSTSAFSSTTIAPSAMSVTPTLSGQASSPLDETVGKYIRGIIDKEPGWTAFVENRKRLLTVREQLQQYAYVQGVFDRFVGSATPAELEGAGGVVITRTQVMRAFNLQLPWGDQCTEALALSALYGAGGTRGEDGRAVGMLDEVPPVATRFAVEKYLGFLRETHAKWSVSHPSG